VLRQQAEAEAEAADGKKASPTSGLPNI